MVRKEMFIAKVNRKREIASLVISCAYGALLGFECSISLFSETASTSPALGYVLIILLAPVATYQTTVALVTDMTSERKNKMRESLKIMGLNQYVYALSHLSVKTLLAVFLALIMSAFVYLYNTKYMEFGQFIGLLFAFILSAIGNMCLCLVL